jgi:ribonuclease VapC
MVLDTSAIIAIFFEEPGFRALAEKINGTAKVVIGAPTAFETALVLEKKGTLQTQAVLMEFFENRNIDILPLEEAHHRSAFSAFLRYGKGRHPAQLNFGDCLSYAVADVAGLPLLFTGDDFSKTDIEAA